MSYKQMLEQAARQLKMLKREFATGKITWEELRERSDQLDYEIQMCLSALWQRGCITHIKDDVS